MNQGAYFWATHVDERIGVPRLIRHGFSFVEALEEVFLG